MGQEFRYKPGQLVPGTDLKIIRGIGSGGMGAVYEVEETSVEAPFVMKVVHAHLLSSGSRVAERMRQEAKTQARLNHKNIVRVYRAGVTAESPPLPFYVMDRLSGYAVRHVLRWHRSKSALVPLSWVFWIGASLLQALDHAHKNGVIHRDVKPDNIFIHHVEGHKPTVKLLDFGIMAAVSDFSEKKRLTVGGFAGTYTHAAPEQLQGAPPAPTLDIYAVGMVLYEMLAGRHPFENKETPEQIVYAHIHEPPPPILQRPGLHPKLEALVQQMLAKDPKERPQTVQDALSSLARVKTEWMQQSTDSGSFDAVEFQFEADIGERWPTNVEGDGDLDASEAVRSRTPVFPSAALLASPELENLAVADLAGMSEPGKASVPTRSEWGRTVDRKGPLLRIGQVAAAAAGFAALTFLGTWLWMRATVAPATSSTVSRGDLSSGTPPASTHSESVPLATSLAKGTDPAAMDTNVASSGSGTPSPTSTPPAASSASPTKSSPFVVRPGSAKKATHADSQKSRPADDPMRP